MSNSLILTQKSLVRLTAKYTFTKTVVPGNMQCITVQVHYAVLNLLSFMRYGCTQGDKPHIKQLRDTVQDKLLHSLVLHNLVLHNLVLHNLVLHNLVLHNLVLHNLMLHNLVLITKQGAVCESGTVSIACRV